MRDRLDELGLVSFCKTTGGKGLHVVTPLAVSSRKP
jgi:bifunctional non-homologous end joining protein LigD